jgi:hypothetical protein
MINASVAADTSGPEPALKAPSVASNRSPLHRFLDGTAEFLP